MQRRRNGQSMMLMWMLVDISKCWGREHGQMIVADGVHGRAQLRDKFYMRHALQEGRGALACGEVPVGCVIIRGETVLSRGHNLVNACKDATRHAELVAIDKLVEALRREGASGRLLEGCEMFVTCEPCVMCAAAIGMLGVNRVVMGCSNSVFGGTGSLLSLDKGLLSHTFHVGTDTTSLIHAHTHTIHAFIQILIIYVQNIKY